MAEEKMFEEEEERWRIRCIWNGEMWCPFHIAAAIIDCQLDVSRGLAERMLRELCAKGDVRSIREHDPDDEEEVLEEPEFIRPSEWLGKELDLEVKYPHSVAVSQDDVLYWIDKQSNKRQLHRRGVSLAEFFALRAHRIWLRGVSPNISGHGEKNERSDGYCVAFQNTEPDGDCTEPGERPFDNPSFGQDLKPAASPSQFRASSPGAPDDNTIFSPLSAITKSYERNIFPRARLSPLLKNHPSAFSFPPPKPPFFPRCVCACFSLPPHHRCRPPPSSSLPLLAILHSPIPPTHPSAPLPRPSPMEG